MAFVPAAPRLASTSQQLASTSARRLPRARISAWPELTSSAVGPAVVGIVASRGRSRRIQRRASSWSALEKKAEATDAGAQILESLSQREAGLAPHTDAKVRYFGTDRAKPRVTLYRDQAAWCPYCQKVWLLLEEKRVDYKVTKVPMRSYGDKPDAFMSKVRNGILPAIEIDGQLMTESLQIMFTLERLFPDPERPMFPSAGALQQEATELLQLERQLFGAWCQYLFRPQMPFMDGSENDFTAALEAVDAALGRSESPFFLPYSYPSIVDMQYVSHMERTVASAMYYKGYDVRNRFPNIDKWLTAYEKLPHYMASKSDYYTHCMDIPPQYGECFSNDNDMAKQARSLIDPEKASLSTLDWKSSIEPPAAHQLEQPEEDFRIEAAMSLIRNQEAVTRFCCRAAGSDVGSWAFGNPTKAKLADPFAKPQKEYLAPVAVVLRCVATALLGGDAGELRSLRSTLEAEENSSQADASTLANCVAYLRDRVGSPRDLSMPAAKLLRAYLGEAVLALKAV